MSNQNTSKYSTDKGCLILDGVSECHLCDTGQMTWIHLLGHCHIIRSLNLMKPPHFPALTNDFDLQMLLLSDPIPANIWYLFKVAKSTILHHQ